MCYTSKDKVLPHIIRLDCILRSSNAKQRKKCNEVRPRCSRCSERDLGCEYEVAIIGTDRKAPSFAETAVGHQQPWAGQAFFQPETRAEDIIRARCLLQDSAYQKTKIDADLSTWTSDRWLQLVYLWTGTSYPSLPLPWDFSVHTADSSFLCRCAVCTRHPYGWYSDASGVASASYGGFTTAATEYDRYQGAAMNTSDYLRYPLETIPRHRRWDSEI
jgi:hypothetical protein